MGSQKTRPLTSASGFLPVILFQKPGDTTEDPRVPVPTAAVNSSPLSRTPLHQPPSPPGSLHSPTALTPQLQSLHQLSSRERSWTQRKSVSNSRMEVLSTGREF